MRLFILALCFIGLWLTSALRGQAPAAPVKTPPAAAPAAPPHPTELEQAKLENIQLRVALIQQEELSLPQRRQELQQQYGQIIQQIEHEHPGYVWNPQVGGLVVKPEPTSKAAEKKPETKK